MEHLATQISTGSGAAVVAALKTRHFGDGSTRVEGGHSGAVPECLALNSRVVSSEESPATQQLQVRADPRGSALLLPEIRPARRPPLKSGVPYVQGLLWIRIYLAADSVKPLGSNCQT